MQSKEIFIHAIDHFFHDNKEGYLKDENQDRVQINNHATKEPFNVLENFQFEKYEKSIGNNEFDIEFLNHLTEDINSLNFKNAYFESKENSIFLNYFNVSNLRSNSEKSFYSSINLNPIKNYFNYIKSADLKNEIVKFKAKRLENFKCIIYKRISTIQTNFFNKLYFRKSKSDLIKQKINSSKQKNKLLIYNENQVLTGSVNFKKNNQNFVKEKIYPKVKNEEIFNRQIIPFSNNYYQDLDRYSCKSNSCVNTRKKFLSIFSLLNLKNSSFFSHLKKCNESKIEFTNEEKDLMIYNNQSKTQENSISIENMGNIKKNETLKRKNNNENSIFNLIIEDNLILNKNLNMALKNSLKGKRKSIIFDNCIKTNDRSFLKQEPKLKIFEIIKKGIDIDKYVKERNRFYFFDQNKSRILKNFNLFKEELDFTSNKNDLNRNPYYYDSSDENEGYKSFNFFLDHEKEIENINNTFFYKNKNKVCYNISKESNITENININNEIYQQDYIQFASVPVKLKISSFLVNENFPNKRSISIDKTSKVINDAFDF